MKCASALSTARNSEVAFGDVLDRVAEGLGDEGGDLALVFASPDHADAIGGLSNAIRARGLARHVLGCTGESIVGEDREVEGTSAVSLWAIRLPGVTPRPVHLTFDEEGFRGWPEGLEPASDSALLLLGDPFSFPTDRWLKQLDSDHPGLRVIGGMASGGDGPGRNRLVLDDRVTKAGAVGVLLDGPAGIRTVVSQGCRPIGRPMIVTKAEENVIRELGRRPAIEVVQELFDGLSPAEQDLMRQGLHVGRVINEYQEKFRRGDFLVRNVIGVDQAGGIAIGDLIRVGQTVQFHVRDAATADEDLRTLLGDRPGPDVAGALLFTCNGRGSRLFPTPNHDVGVVREVVGPVPVAGFFAMGEIGPVGGRNFVHGFTASLALFERL